MGDAVLGVSRRDVVVGGHASWEKNPCVDGGGVWSQHGSHAGQRGVARHRVCFAAHGVDAPVRRQEAAAAPGDGLTGDANRDIVGRVRV